MLKDLDLKKYTTIYIRTGMTDLRHGLKWLINLGQCEFRVDPYDKHALFLFCGCNSRRIRRICWEGDGWIIFNKVLYGDNRFQWPRTPQEAKRLLTQQDVSLKFVLYLTFHRTGGKGALWNSSVEKRWQN